MAEKSIDLFVIGGGINGAAVARDAAGRGLSVMLAEKGDYACATSSASSNLIHGGLRYLETYQFGLVRHSLKERKSLLHAAPYLVEPLQFLVPSRDDQKRPAWMVYAGLKLYDLLGGSRSLPASGTLTDAQIDALPRLRRKNLKAVLHYHDCRTDDARLVLALLLDAREHNADISNYRAVTAIDAIEHGYRVAYRQDGVIHTAQARFVVNAAGPWANTVNGLCSAPPRQHSLRLVRGSHIVLPMPDPAQHTAFTLQNDDGRVVFTLPWLDEKFLVIGTTDQPHDADAMEARCTPHERDYLLRAYNRYFSHPGGRAAPEHVVSSWSGVRPLADDGRGDLSKVTRSAVQTWRRQGNGGIITLYGGKLTTHRDLAETVLRRLSRMGAPVARSWTRNAILPGGHAARDQLEKLAQQGPDTIPPSIRLRWAHTYGDRIALLYDRIMKDQYLVREIAPGVPEAELHHAREDEDAVRAQDFLYRRTKLYMTLSLESQRVIARFFGDRHIS